MDVTKRIISHASWSMIISPPPLHAVVDRRRLLIADKHTEILDCIPRKHTNKHTNGADGWTLPKRIISVALQSIKILY